MSYIPNISVQINGLDSPTVGSFWDGNIDPPGLPILHRSPREGLQLFRGPPQLRKLGPGFSLAAESEPLTPMADSGNLWQVLVDPRGQKRGKTIRELCSCVMG